MEIDINKYKAFFFDFDGVIVDSVDIKSQAFGELFKDYGEDVVKKVMDYHLNEGWAMSRYEKFKYYYKNIFHKKISQEIIDELDRRFSQLVTEKVAKAPFVKGVVDFLKKLNENGKQCFVISATPQEEVKHITKLKQIDVFFKEIVGSPMTKKENLQYLLNKYVINSDKAVYFGDTKNDYEVAVENAIGFIGVEYGANKELKELHNIHKIKDFLFNNINKKEGAECKSHSK